MEFTEGVPPDLVDQMITKSGVDHPERYPLAFVYSRLYQHDLLASLNLVECVACNGAQPQSK